MLLKARGCKCTVMNLLVMGGCGELGFEVVLAAHRSNAVAKCIATYNRTAPTEAESKATQGVEWVSLDCSDHAAACRVLEESSASAVIYCAIPKHGGASGKGGASVGSGIVADVVNLASAKRPDVRFVALSTDLVFDGSRSADERYSESDTVSPTNFYARAKADMESQLLLLPNVCVARTSLILTLGSDWDGSSVRKAHGKGVQFVLDALDGILPGQTGAIQMFTDELRCMSFSDDLAAALLELAKPSCEHQGIVHLASDEVTTRYELACRLASYFSKSDFIGKTVCAGLSSESGLYRPLNCALNTALLQSLLAGSNVHIRGLSERLPRI
jgi:dTDP-4-dehydrorhamnose reductase